MLYELGVDFGEIDLEPEYGQGDFEAGQVVVEFRRLTPSTIAPVTTHAGTELLLEGSEMIWEFFSHGETTHFDVWNFLLDGDAIVHIEGTVPPERPPGEATERQGDAARRCSGVWAVSPASGDLGETSAWSRKG